MLHAQNLGKKDVGQTQMADSTAPPSATAPVNSVEKKRENKPRAKYAFMLHHPTDRSSLGKFVATDAITAARKVASRADHGRYASLWLNGKGDDAVATILLRQTRTKDVRWFEGRSVKLDEPKIIKRGTQEVKYGQKPVVRELKDRRFVLEGQPDAEDAPAAPAAPVATP